MRAVAPFVFALCLACSLAAAVPVTGTVHDATGKPLAGVQVYVLVTADRSSWSFREPARTVTTGADGAFALDWPLAAEEVSYATIVAYQPGLAVDFYSASKLEPLSFVLKPATPIVGSVLGSDGKPLAGARATLVSCWERAEGRSRHGSIPEALQNLLAAQTDAQGQYTLTCVSEGVRPTIAVKAAGYGETMASFEKAVGPIRLEAAGGLRGQITCADAGVKLEGWDIVVHGDRAYSQGSYFYSTGSAKTDAEGRFACDELPPADYQVTVRPPMGVNYGTRGSKTTVASGQTAEVTITAAKQWPVKGRIIGADTKQGLPGISVSGDPGTRTAADGTFTLQCLAGDVSIYAYDPERNYRSTNSGATKPYTLAPPGLEVGDVVLEPALALTVLVVDIAGKPVPRARINYRQSGDRGGPPFLGDGPLVDDQGSYTIKGLGNDTLVIAAGKDDLASEQTQVDVSKQQGPVKLVLRPGLMSTITATLKDQDGKPVTDATVQLYESTQQYGMSHSVPRADAQGVIKAEHLTAGSAYSFKIEAPGCWPVQTPQWTAVAGQTHDCGVITLTRNRGVVAGKVVDADGKPVGGAMVVCSLETPKPVVVATGADGSFRLTGLLAGDICLFVHTGGVRCTAQMVKTGQENLTLKAPAAGPLAWAAEATPRADAAVPPEATKQAQDLLLEALEKTKGADFWDRWVLLLALAKLNPQLALQTAAAGGDKDDCVRAVMAMQHLCDAPDDARLMLQALAPEQAQQSIMYVHRYSIANVAPALGARIGEALLECARRQRGYDSVCGWAIALRWLQRYDPPRAAALIPDLLLRARTLGVAESDAYARAMAAGVIAPQDLDAALELLKPIPDDNERQRHTAKLAPRVATTNPQRALELLRGLKQDWYRDRYLPECLAAFPTAQRDLALAEARKLTNTSAKARTLAKLAQLLPREQAPALLVEAAETVLRGRSERNYPFDDSVAGPLAVGLVAQRLGCTDYREIMWRGLSMYDCSSGYDMNDGVRGQVALASRLGTADPALGRHIVEVGLQRMGDWTKQEAYVQENVVSAAAAADPQWALQLVRQMPLDPDVKKRDRWAAAMRVIADRLAESDAERASALLSRGGSGASWLAEDDALD